MFIAAIMLAITRLMMLVIVIELVDSAEHLFTAIIVVVAIAQALLTSSPLVCL